MSFNQLCHIFTQLEQERSRLSMMQTLAQLFNDLDSQEVQMVSYFCMGQLQPSYKNVQFNIAQKTAAKVVGQLLDLDEHALDKALAHAADEGQLLIQGSWKPTCQLSISQVYNRLEKLAALGGQGSQETRRDDLYQLLRDVEPLSAKFLLRIVLATLRMGFSDMTIIDALSIMLSGNRKLADVIEDAYNVCADIGLVARTAKEKGIEGIRAIQVHLGIPVRLAAAERLASPNAIIKKIGHCVAEPKLDGFRLQIHVDKHHGGHIWFFSRNLVDMSAMYPDLVKALEELKVKNAIIEGEAIAFDANTGSFMPFQQTVKRKRKHDVGQAAQDMPLQIYLFDILYLDGKTVFNQPLSERRQLLEDVVDKSPIDKNIVRTMPQVKLETAQALEDYFLEQVGHGLEGIVAKRPDSPYQPGKRNFNWIKLKRLESGHLLDTIDCVVLGYYHGSGKRAEFGIGAILVGLYNKKCDCFQTVAKVGTGFSDEQWQDLKKQCDKLKTDHRPSAVECDKQLYPDVWIAPTLVIEVRADEITRSPVHTAGRNEQWQGLALRFPRFMRYRPDKDATESTSVHELVTLAHQQRKT